jgi:hypothetical protein
MDAPTLFPTNLVVPLLASSLAGGILGTWRARRCGEAGSGTLFAGIEVFGAILLGALAARTFAWSLLALLSFTPASVFGVGLSFLLWPGVFDAVAWLISGKPMFDPDSLVGWATAFGVLVGFWDGLRQIHDWRRGGLSFLIDVTWGGAAVSLALLAHFLNLGWGRPLPSRRCGAHRYDAGVCAAPRYAIALGNLCGNLRGRGDTDLFTHESIHVLQNRLFGPLFLFTYILWPIVMLLPAFVYGLLVRRPFEVVWSWCYLNNPWEEWAYRHGGGRPPHLVWTFWPARLGSGDLLD